MAAPLARSPPRAQFCRVTAPRSSLAAALEGRYTIDRELGAGDMATVYPIFDDATTASAVRAIVRRAAE